MTELTMTQLALLVVGRVKDQPMTKAEIDALLIRERVDGDVAKNFTTWMASKQYLKISPCESKDVRWTVGPRAYTLEAES